MEKTNIALATTLILLITTSIIAIYLNTNLNTLTSEYNIIVTERDELTSQVNELSSQVNDLSSKIEEYETPRLRANVDFEDKGAYLQITGEVWNVGHKPAYYCKLHVILYDGDNNVVKEQYVHIGDNIGMIAEQSYDIVDAKVYYEGAQVSYWQINPVVGVT